MLVRLLIPLLVPITARAEATASAALGSRVAPMESLGQVLLALLAVIAVIFALAWLARRVQGGVGFSTRGMKVVSVLSLTPRERVVLVQVGKEQLLLGVAPGRVSLLERFEQPVVDLPQTKGDDFGQRLRQALGKEAER